MTTILVAFAFIACTSPQENSLTTDQEMSKTVEVMHRKFVVPEDAEVHDLADRFEIAVVKRPQWLAIDDFL